MRKLISGKTRWMVENYNYKNFIDLQKLNELFYYKDGKLLNKKDNGTRAKAHSEVGHTTKWGYRRVCINQTLFYVHRVIYALHHNRWPQKQIDHINRNKLDNRIENLREVTRSENCLNKAPTSGSIWFHKKRKQWQACGRRDKYLGWFKCPVMANLARIKYNERLDV